MKAINLTLLYQKGISWFLRDNFKLIAEYNKSIPQFAGCFYVFKFNLSAPKWVNYMKF